MSRICGITGRTLKDDESLACIRLHSDDIEADVDLDANGQPLSLGSGFFVRNGELDRRGVVKDN